MSFIKQQRSWFFRTNATLNTEGKRINLEDGSRPDQDLFERLTASALFFTESDDRARLSTGGAIENEVGHVAVTTDAKAKAGTSGLEADRTLVTHAAQLPTSEADTDTVDDFSGNVLDVTADAGTTTRNRYLFKLAAGFKSWLISRLIPAGGAANEVLSKIDGTDYNVQWSAAAAAGETNTASNVNVGGVGVFKQKTGVDFEFKGINNGDAYIAVADDAANNEIDISLDEAAVLSYVENNITLTNLTTTWNSLSTANIELGVRSGSPGSYIYTFDSSYVPNTVTGNIRYTILGNTVHLAFSLNFRAAKAVGSTSAVTYLKVAIDVSSIGSVANNNNRGGMYVESVPPFDSPENIVGAFCGTNATDDVIFFNIPLVMASGVSNSEYFSYHGGLTYEIA